jgi:hypothetical protein
VETFDAELRDLYSEACGWVLARAHLKASEVRVIAHWMGSGDAFDEVIGDFTLAYADQPERDPALLKAAVRKGKVDALTGA